MATRKSVSLNVRLCAIMSVFLALILVLGGFVVWSARKSDAQIINLAGRQRMLAQKYAQEYLGELNDRQLVASAERTAAVATAQIVADRAYYTQNVVGKLKGEIEAVQADHDYRAVHGAIPLPATFVREVSESLGDSALYRYDLLSKWNINKDKALRDDFERQAWEHLAANPQQPYAQVVTSSQGADIRYATADLANADTCVACHNSHAGSPKKDFKLGDLMGMLVVTTPVTGFSTVPMQE